MNLKQINVESETWIDLFYNQEVLKIGFLKYFGWLVFNVYYVLKCNILHFLTWYKLSHIFTQQKQKYFVVK